MTVVQLVTYAGTPVFAVDDRWRAPPMTGFPLYDRHQALAPEVIAAAVAAPRPRRFPTALLMASMLASGTSVAGGRRAPLEDDDPYGIRRLARAAALKAAAPAVQRPAGEGDAARRQQRQDRRRRRAQARKRGYR